MYFVESESENFIGCCCCSPTSVASRGDGSRRSLFSVIATPAGITKGIICKLLHRAYVTKYKQIGLPVINKS